MQGHLERVTRHGAAGWAIGPDGPARVDLSAAGRHLSSVEADTYRADLAAAHLAGGFCAWEAWFDPPLPPATQVEATVGGRHLGNSPLALPFPGQRPSGDPTGHGLFIDAALPDPDRDAGGAAATSHIASLRRLGLTVAVASLADAPAALAARPYALIYLHRLEVAAACLDLARTLQPTARIAYCVADLHHLRNEREARITNRPARDNLRAVELTLLGASDVAITHSPAEAALLGTAGVLAHIVPWAVPLPAPAQPADRGIVFLGSYGHAPNRDAAAWLIDAVMPHVWVRNPDIPLFIAGTGLPAAIADRASPRVRILGTVPTRDHAWRHARIAIAPLRFGAGLKGKVLDALAAGMPCVMSTIAAEGLDLPPLLAALVADDPHAIAALVLALHVTPAYERIAAQGRTFISETFSEAAVDAAMRRALSSERDYQRKPAT